MISNIPIYRAKKIDSDEYVESNLIEDEGVYYIIKNPVITHFYGLQQLTGEYEYLHKIDISTLAIHFPDMLDSQGNKIFASLQEDGKGGDILYYKSKIDLVTKTTLYFENYRLITHSKGENTFRDKESLSKFEIIGIKE